MINPIFKTKYKFLSEYFETFFKSKKRFPQSVVFEGLDILGQYFFACELARILNCSEDRNPDCSCTNCKWIKESKHPSIINVTPLDFKEDASRTVISVKQIEKITSIINETSDYHRFFIFSNAKELPLNENQKTKLKEYEEKGFLLSKEDWYPYPLNRKILQEEASNALLKSTEEAPDKVTFVFLSNTKEDIISTIVSRSLVFKVPSLFEKNKTDVSEFFENYPNLDIETSLEKGNFLLDKINAENLDIINVLDSMQEYLAALLRSNLNLKETITADIKKINETKKQITALVGTKYAIESLFISLSKEGRNL